MWLFQFEDEIRTKVPLMYYHLWDNYPVPKYNTDYFKSVDWIGYINKLSGDIVRKLDNKFVEEPWRMKYVPHGVDERKFAPLENKDFDKYKTFMQKFLNTETILDDFDYTIFWNNRNIKRKQAIDVVYGYKLFLDRLTQEQRDRCLLMLHTAPSDEHGTDLRAVIKQTMPQYLKHVVFSKDKLTRTQLGYLYNFADVTVNLANNEGYGLSNSESLMSGTMTITTVTGGLQDQLGIEYENGDTIFTEEVWSNGLKPVKVGEWSIPLFPDSRTLNGSIPTPYIFEDRADILTYTSALMELYNMPKEERKAKGKMGREFLLNEGHNVTSMVKNFKDALQEIDVNWKSQDNFTITKI